MGGFFWPVLCVCMKIRLVVALQVRWASGFLRMEASFPSLGFLEQSECSVQLVKQQA